MMDITKLTKQHKIQLWVSSAHQLQFIEWMDRYYMLNRVAKLIGEQPFEWDDRLQLIPFVQNEIETVFYQLTDWCIEQAIENDIISHSAQAKEEFVCELMDVLMPFPSIVQQRFEALANKKMSDATDYFYRISQLNQYVKKDAISKNRQFLFHSKYGKLEITINLSKPEKDPKAIAAAIAQPKTDYPQTVLAFSNEGYYGDTHHAARSQHRIIRLQLAEEPFGFQYSPYGYFDEHCILMSEKIRPMQVDEQCLHQLFDALDQMPYYVIGSNADLPIVGGSILTHHHFQGGRHRFPMQDAPMLQSINCHHDDVKGGVIYWPLTVLRLMSSNRTALVKEAWRMISFWKNYDDVSNGIHHVSLVKGNNKIKHLFHNTVTPIVYRENDEYIIDLVLRNNETSAQYPDGIHHPHQKKHHIKKENIGLIEVMGRAILPGRLEKTMKLIVDYLCGNGQLHAIPEMHHEWVLNLKNEPFQLREQAEQFVEHEIGKIFEACLEDCAMFSFDEMGQNGLNRFLNLLNTKG